MKCKWILALLLLVLAVSMLGVVSASALGGYTLDWWTVDGGGGSSSGGPYAVNGATGQPDAGVALASGAYTVSGGFWGGAGSSGNTIPLTAGWNLKRDRDRGRDRGRDREIERVKA